MKEEVFPKNLGEVVGLVTEKDGVQFHILRSVENGTQYLGQTVDNFRNNKFWAITGGGEEQMICLDFPIADHKKFGISFYKHDPTLQKSATNPTPAPSHQV